MTTETAATRLHRLVDHRDVLRPAFRTIWRRLPKADPDALDDWARAAIELIEVNAGPACQLAFWKASVQMPLPPAAFSARAAAEICRNAGARAALDCLEALPAVQAMAPASDAQAIWWRGMQRLARDAADSVAPVAAHAQTLLADRNGQVFANFIAAGLKAYPTDTARRRAFFSLEDPFARALLARRPGIPGFRDLSRLLTAYAAALWGDAALLKAAPTAGTSRPRASLSGRIVLLPDAVDAATPADASRLYRAAVAHACAHLAAPAPRRPVGKLKPLQIELITLIEDARVEALATRAFPGLRQLWAPFHTAEPTGPRTAPNLMARLSRALFDPGQADPDGFVAKGASMFAEAASALEDPAISVGIGRVLGNDLGQMRVQFNWRDYVIEPAYRDNGAHLWESPDAPDSALDLMVQAARSRPNDAGRKGGAEAPAAGRARNKNAEDQGTLIASYPEWDAAIGQERPDWTDLRDAPARAADPGPLLAAMHGQNAVRRRIAGLIRAARIGQPVRLKRQPDGDDLDMDAVLDAAVALRAGQTPDTRLFKVTRPRSRDLATVAMLDASASTAARLADGRTVLDVQCLALALLAEALDASGDPLALRAFASNGREDVRLTRIKDFNEPMDASVLARLSGLRPGLSTRLGTVLRHARTEFATIRAWRRLLLVLTDGEPSDIDVANSTDLVLDARRAVLGLKQAGIDTFGIVLDPAGVGSATAIFGRSNAIPITNLADLPARLAGLYFRLARR